MCPAEHKIFRNYFFTVIHIFQETVFCDERRFSLCTFVASSQNEAMSRKQLSLKTQLVCPSNTYCRHPRSQLTHPSVSPLFLLLQLHCFVLYPSGTDISTNVKYLNSVFILLPFIKPFFARTPRDNFSVSPERLSRFIAALRRSSRNGGVPCLPLPFTCGDYASYT